MTYGCNIRSNKASYADNDRLHKYDKINLHKIKRKFIAITANKSEIVDNQQDIVTVAASYRRSSKDFQKKYSDTASGVVLLFIVVFDTDINERHFSWTDEHYNKLKYSKNNILASSKSKHFNSTGQYYSFGNKGNFGMIGTSSVGIYCSKSYKNIKSNEKAKKYAKEMEDIAGNEVKVAVKNIGCIIPNVHKLISPVVDVAYDMQDSHGSVNLTNVNTSSSGLWQSKVCINASTEKWHTENDASYTLVSVPKQSSIENVVFFFKFNSNKCIGIPMKSGVSFISSMKLLTHRQQVIAHANRTLDPPVNLEQLRQERRLNTGAINNPENVTTPRPNQNYVNVCSYANKKLFSHIRTSFNRNTTSAESNEEG